MLIEIIGMDPFRVGEVSRVVQPKLNQISELKDTPIIFTGSDTSLFHHGVDQNTWVVIMKLHLEQNFLHLASQIQSFIVSALKDDAIHMHVYVFPLPSEHLTFHRNPDYPPYVQENEEEEETTLPPQDIFLGNAFEKHQDELDEKVSKSNPFSLEEDEDSHKH